MKHLFAVFAHPDDEAFGPAGTLLTESDAGTALHLILLTAGEQGRNPNNEDLARIRLEEWKCSGTLLGAQSQTFFGYPDGGLTNTIMQEVSQRLEKLIQETVREHDDEIELMSFEFGGITGHIDHIVAARATAATFCRLKAADSRCTRLRLFCLPQHLKPERDSSWIYAEAGSHEAEIDETVDARHLRKRIEAVIDTHTSQREDARFVKELLGEELGINWFKILR